MPVPHRVLHRAEHPHTFLASNLAPLPCRERRKLSVHCTSTPPPSYTVVYVDLGVRAILDIFFDNGEELLKVSFAVLDPDRLLELRHVHKKLEGLRISRSTAKSRTRADCTTYVSASRGFTRGCSCDSGTLAGEDSSIFGEYSHPPGRESRAVTNTKASEGHIFEAKLNWWRTSNPTQCPTACRPACCVAGTRRRQSGSAVLPREHQPAGEGVLLSHSPLWVEIPPGFARRL